MKEALVEKITADLKDWQYLQKLPEDKFGFKLVKMHEEEGDKFFIFGYVNEGEHCKVLAYFHQETMEYKLKVHIGLTDFCVVEYICDNLEEMAQKLEERLDGLLKTLVAVEEEAMSSLVAETGVLNWEYGSNLPQEIAGFQLFIKPTKPIRTINGSYIIMDYSNFQEQCNFVILYNILREEFSAEMKFRNIPEITYDFDANSLEELENKLKEQLQPTLENLAKRIAG